MFEIISLISKYVFVTIIYLFIFGIMRLIYLDIKSIKSVRTSFKKDLPYLKLLNLREQLDFKIEESYILDKSLTLGRADACDIVIRDPYISGRHAKFFPKDGTCFIEDLNSKNGTFLNDSVIEAGYAVPLKDGDKIKAGGIEFLFISGSMRGEN